MYLTRHSTSHGARWAVDGKFLPGRFHLGAVLSLPAQQVADSLTAYKTSLDAVGELLAPIEHDQEVWASGVTFLRSREARMEESDTKDVYEKVYDAERVEVFAKAVGWRVRGPNDEIRVRADSAWNVPEPELTLVLNSAGVIVGYCVGNDVSSRSIEGENPLYLPQAKVYDGSCALGPGIVIASADEQRALAIELKIEREGQVVFEGTTSSDQLKRSLEEIAAWMTKELSFPDGAFLMTGTGVVPPDSFTLTPGDRVRVSVGNLSMENRVADH
ncbi:MAG: fumarylacetoacetate hydrolase family protein [Gammaproteobacteria bacterium]|nr:fumarylacetoacetate hydrolase family protein [Gammaproteobacteria bacterium]